MLTSFAAIGAAAFLFDDDSDGGNEDTDTGDTYDVSGGDTITGSEGDDVFLADIDAGTYENVSIDAGAGDDTLAFFDPEAEDDPTNTVAEFYQATINAGAGNDLIDIFASSSEIQGGDGDDTISVYGGTVIYGEAGNDVLSAELFNSDPVLLDGGDGDDTIDARSINNGWAVGGEGNDLINISGGFPSGGTGYTFTVDGGEGDDTIQYEAGSYHDFINDFPDIHGGEGSDTFALRINEGDLVLPSQDELMDMGSELITVEDGIVRLEAISLSDYDPETDVIEIDASSVSDEFELTTARLETTQSSTDETVTFTSLVLRYVSDEGEVRDIDVGLGTADVTLDDIEFVGDEIPTFVMSS